MDAVSSTATQNSGISAYFQEIVKRRQENQAQRISQGLQSGQLNESQADRLTKVQERIDKLDQKAASDGTMTGSEFARIMHAQDKAGEKIARFQHNHGASHGFVGSDGLASNAQMTGSTAAGAPLAEASASNAQMIGATVSNAALVGATASNAGTAGSAAWADMSKLFQDIAQYRQDRQAERIQNGIDSGQLSPKEQQKLTDLEAKSADMISKAQMDGVISPQEFANIMHAQNKASHRIFSYRQNHNFGQDFKPEYSAMDGPAGEPPVASIPQSYKPVSLTV